MSNLVADSLELQDLDNGYLAEITLGGLDSTAEARRTEITVPGKPGLTFGGGVLESRTIVIHTFVIGTPSMGVSAQESYRSRMDALLAVFDPTAEPFPLTIHPTAWGVGGGIASGETATLNVIFDRLTGGPAWMGVAREFDLECRCIDDPPMWVISGGS